MNNPVPAPSDGAVRLEDCLDAVIHRHPAVDMVHDPRIGFLLTWKQMRRTGLRRILGWISGAGRMRRVKLDDVGRRTMELVDGKTTVRAIADTLSREFGFKKTEARGALLAFLTMLMKRNIIVLSLPDANTPEPM